MSSMSHHVDSVQLCVPPVCHFLVSLCIYLVCVILCSSLVLLPVIPCVTSALSQRFRFSSLVSCFFFPQFRFWISFLGSTCSAINKGSPFVILHHCLRLPTFGSTKCSRSSSGISKNYVVKFREQN